MRCAGCGASNPAEARWCNQCFTPAAGQVVADRPPTPTPGAPSERDGHVDGSARAPTPEGFRRRDGVVEWRCPRCASYSSLEEASCRTCGAPVTERFAEPEHSQPPRPWTTALWLSAVAPGAGHLLVDRITGGIARLLLFLVWLVGGWTVLAADGPGGAVAAPLLLGAAVIWVGSLADLVTLARGDREVLAGRVLLWLVVGVTGLTLLGAVASAAMITP